MTRKATLVDLEQLHLLFDAYRVFYHKESDKNGAYHFLQERIENDESVVFVDINSENTISGFVQLYPLFSSTRMKRLWLLNDLYVAEHARKTGVARRLLDACKYFCLETGAAGFILETAKDNIEANHLYQAFGLSLDTDHNYYTCKL